jgi:glycosyltransferase involved in cell wall biosynthesis
MEKNVCRSKMNLDFNKKYILFSSSFDNPVKNYKLAKEALSQLNYQNLEIIELKNYNRKEVAMLMNASDIGLLTSFSEGSPQFIKEAIACNLPLISTDVGDVKEIIENIEGCYICDFNSFLLAEKIKKVLIDNTRINGGKHVTNFDCKMISEKMTTIYNTIIS